MENPNNRIIMGDDSYGYYWLCEDGIRSIVYESRDAAAQAMNQNIVIWDNE
jgi:spore germination protein YaaH